MFFLKKKLAFKITISFYLKKKTCFCQREEKEQKLKIKEFLLEDTFFPL